MQDIPFSVEYSNYKEELVIREKLYDLGLSFHDIAALTFRTYSSMANWARRTGRKPNVPHGFPGAYQDENGKVWKSAHHITAKEEALRMRLYNMGLLDPQIAKQCKTTDSAIFHWRKSRGLESNAKRYGR